MEWSESISRDIWKRPLPAPKPKPEPSKRTWWDAVRRWWRRGYVKLKQI